MAMRIAISGGLGFVGGRLTKYLAEAGHQVVSFSRQAGSLSHISFPGNVVIAHPDDKGHLKGVDAFIHLAALDEHHCVKFPFEAIDVNIAHTLAWLDHAFKEGVKKFIYFSTAHVYGRPLEGYYDENTITRPVHPYAITHKCAEDYVLAYSADQDMCNTVLRLTNSFGGPAYPTANRWTLLVNDLSRSAVNTGKMILQSDGMQLRDFVCLHDVCRGIEHLLSLNETITKGEIYNLGAGQSVSIWDLAVQVKGTAEKVLGRQIELVRKNPTAVNASPPLTISIEKLLKTGFQLTNNVEEEIRAALQYFKSYPT